MRMLARSHRAAWGAVLLGVVLGVALAIAVSSDPFGSRPHPGSLLDVDLETGTVRFDVKTETASVHLHALSRGLVVVTGADNCNTRPAREEMYAYSVPSGALRWQRRLAGACSDFSEPDEVSGGVVAVHIDRGVEGWDAATGKTRWQVPLPEDDPPRQSASTIVSPNSGSSGHLHFIAAQSGRVERSVDVDFRPAVWAMTPTTILLIVQSSSGPGFRQEVGAIDARTGRRLWSATVGGEGGFYAPRTADGVTIVGTIPGATSNTATYSAFDLRDGRLLWRQQRRTVEVGSPGELEAAGAGLALFVQEGTQTLQALDVRTGTLRWKHHLVGWRTRGSSEVVAGAGSVAVIDQGKVTVFDARDGTRRWSRPLLSAGLRAHAPAAILNGQLLIPSISSAWTPYDE
jgi:outer membrane protein assembly factor BamB